MVARCKSSVLSAVIYSRQFHYTWSVVDYNQVEYISFSNLFLEFSVKFITGQSVDGLLFADQQILLLINFCSLSYNYRKLFKKVIQLSGSQ